PDPTLSPTEFHNSVHNAAAGYWSIGAHSSPPIACIACHDSTFPAALLKAMAQAAVERRAVLLCAYDLPIPGPLGAKRLTSCAFGAALVLSPAAENAGLGRITSEYGAVLADPEDGVPRLPALRPLFFTNAAARSLRLLEALARGEPDTFSLALLDGRIRIDVRPCSTDSKFSP
ncbi:MAG: beta-ketoacyl synthase chain length factor, partial [Acetobacteraceae bacterium]